MTGDDVINADKEPQVCLRLGEQRYHNTQKATTTFADG